MISTGGFFKMAHDIEKMIYDETEKRLAEMESPEYVFPARAGVGTYVGVAVCVAASIVLIVLCMMGVLS